LNLTNDQRPTTNDCGPKERAASSLDWLKEIEIEDLLENDVKFIHECCGLEMLLALWENFPKMTLHISTKPLTLAKKRYIKKHFNGKNVKDLCRLLEVSERFVYEAAEEKGLVHPGQEKLF
jgi:hypothetical protein